MPVGAAWQGGLRMPRSTPPVRGLAVACLRTAKGWTQQELGARAGLDRNKISDLETGDRTVTDETLDLFTRLMGYEPGKVQLLLMALSAIGEPSAVEEPSPVDPTAEERQLVSQAALAMGCSTADMLQAKALGEVRLRRLNEAQAAAERRWLALRNLAPRQAARRIVESPEPQPWALALRLCDESRIAAGDSAARALDLAQLAVLVAQRSVGPAAWCDRLRGYVSGHLANAYRVAGHMHKARSTMERAWGEWGKGGAGDDLALPRWRLLSLEGSLRRDLGDMQGSLECLDRALAMAPLAERAALLIGKAISLEEAGSYQAALAALDEARPAIDAAGDERERYMLRFNLVTNLCALGRWHDAQSLMPDLRRRLGRLGSPAERTMRLRWLTARLAAGLGDTPRAAALFESVRRHYERCRNALDATLVSLEVAVLYLEHGAPAKARGLAENLVWVFRGHGIHREAVAALAIFRAAALRDAATVDLGRQVLAYFRRARYKTELRFAAPG